MAEAAIDQEQNSMHDTEQGEESHDYPMLRMAIQNGFDNAGAQSGESGAGANIGSRIAGLGGGGDGLSAGPRDGVDADPVQRMMDADLLRGPQTQTFETTQRTNSDDQRVSGKEESAATSIDASVGAQLYPTGRMEGYFAGDHSGESSPLDQLTQPLHFGESAAGSSAATTGQSQKPGAAATSSIFTAGEKDKEVLNGKTGNAAAPGGISTTAATGANGSGQQRPAAAKPANGTQPGTAVRQAKGGTDKPQQKQQAAGNTPPPSAKVAVERTRDASQGDAAVRVMRGRKGAPPQQQVRKTMSSVNTAMKDVGMDDPVLMAYAMATIHAETGDGAPRTEGANPSNTTKGGQPFDKYQNNKNLGNKEPGDGERFRGRGFIQLTGRANYEKMAKDTKLDLVNHPELASDPNNASIIFAHYLKWHEGALRGALAKGDMVAARAVVNGRNHDSFLPNGLDNFLPAYQMAQRQSGVSAALEKNQSLSVGEVAKLWTKNDSAEDQSAYLQNLQRLHIDPDKSYAQLTPQERQRLESDQAEHVRNMVKKEMPNLQA